MTSTLSVQDLFSVKVTLVFHSGKCKITRENHNSPTGAHVHLSMSSPRGGGGGSGNPREFDCGVYPQSGDFDRTSSISSFNFIE